MKNARKAVTAVAVLIVLAATATTAQASSYLSVASAKYHAREDIATMAYQLDDYYDHYVTSCSRLSWSAVRCYFTVEYRDGIACDSWIRERKQYGEVLGWFGSRNTIHCYGTTRAVTPAPAPAPTTPTTPSIACGPVTHSASSLRCWHPGDTP